MQSSCGKKEQNTLQEVKKRLESKGKIGGRRWDQKGSWEKEQKKSMQICGPWFKKKKKSFIVLGFTFRSIINFLSFLCMVQGVDRHSVFGKCILLSVICWKSSPFYTKFSPHFCQKSVVYICVGLFLDSVLLPESIYFSLCPYCSVLISVDL